MGVSAARIPIKVVSGWLKLPSSAASSPYRLWQVRISRLLGKFDSTACRPGWQVGSSSTGTKRVHPWTFPPEREKTSDMQNAIPQGWRFAFLRWSLASQLVRADGWSIVPSTSSLGRFSLVSRAASLAVALAERLLFCGAGRTLPSSRYITGTLQIAIVVPFRPSIFINDLSAASQPFGLVSYNP